MEEEKKDAASESELENKSESTAENEPESKKESSGGSVTVDSGTAKKIIYSLCYLWGILFFLPLILYKDDPAAKRHANEGLVLLLFSVIGNAVFGILTRIGAGIGAIFGIVAALYSLALLILGIIGIVYVVTDKDQPLPIIGAIRIIK